MTVKIEIKINKGKLKRNIVSVLFSLLISFILLFIISLFGEIEPLDFHANPKDLVYKGLLTDKYGYRGDGGIEQWSSYWDYYSRQFVQISEDLKYRVQGNFILGYESTGDLTFKQKLFVFYLPLIIFEKFWLWLFLAVIVFLLFKINKYLNSKYTIKFE